MPYYRCIVCNETGKKQQVLVQAGCIDELLDAYAGKNKFLISYEETEETTLQDKRYNKHRKYFSRELIREFTGIMSALLSTGNNIVASLELCAGVGGSSQKKLAELCNMLLEGLRKGERFSGCLLRSTPSFPPLYVALVEIGEKTGTTAEVFKRLSIYLATIKRIRTKVKGTLFYPIFVLVSAVAGSLLILFFLMPRMVEIFTVFSTAGNEIDINGMYTSIYMLVFSIIGIGAAFITVIFLHRYSKRAALALDSILLRMPFLGTFFSSLESLDFCFALELCSKAGMNVESSLGEAQKVVKNRAFTHAIGDIRKTVAAGGTLSQAFASKSIFPSIIGQWVAVGEKTGETETIFSNLKSFFEETVDSFTETFLNSLEPILMLLTGLIVLLLVMQFVLPMFSLYGVVL